MPDIKASWKAYKLSWLRRLMYSKGTWVELFKEAMRPRWLFRNIQTALTNLDLIHLSKNIRFVRSEFWKEILKELPDMMTLFIKKNRSQGLLLNIWGSAILKDRNNRPLESSSYSIDARRIQSWSDILVSETNATRLMTALEVELEYGLRTTEAESLVEAAEFSLGRAGIIVPQAEVE